MQNTRILLNQRPVGTPTSECWRIETVELPEMAEGEVLVKTKYISIDPAMRGWMNDSKSYIKPVEIGETMRALSIGEVIASKNPKFEVGEFVNTATGVQEYAISEGKDFVKVDPKIFPLPAYLGTLGMSGLTAYFGLLDIGQPKEGETVVVSGAAGAVGSVVGQIAKIKGCRVVGIAGGQDKCDYVMNELGFDACIDYKAGNLRKNIKEACPAGVDIYFDNVGGEILDTVLTLINKKARIVVCGAISQYNSTKPEGPKNYLSLLVNRARMEGIVVFDNYARYGEAAKEMAGWILAGKLNANFYIEKGGIKAFPETLIKLFAGENTGKMVLEVDA
ncbi:NADP-dependent oxidoreductase [Lacihabitans sp. CCS-44]|uniref:NADP-dependent oxidoreductase n=1 Tax=Lacihabitans sp. CCS-44 TaxID=2487331 RepID=UPI0020CF1C1E|nr:NADP-dependent oxidoreductase [Lacihabitans sp. CCS-44]MCP9754439.1 NADP-dependent oxidoreductase [Lacihabitans sp. CCS-44]